MVTKSLGFDVDGVIVDTYSERNGFLAEMNRRKGTHYTFKDITTYGMEKIFPITKAELIDIFASLDDTKLDLVDRNCPKVIDDLRSMGYEIELVSAHIPTKTGGLEDLITCLDHHRINFDNITFVDNANPNAKADMAHLFDYFLDDAPYHIKSVSPFTKGVLYLAPYNITELVPYAYASVKDWIDFKELIYHDNAALRNINKRRK